PVRASRRLPTTSSRGENLVPTQAPSFIRSERWEFSLWFATPASAASLAWRGQRSVRHQHRHRHRTQNTARDAAEDEFAQARMAVAAHDEEIGADVGRVRQDRVHHGAAGRDDALHLDLEAVPGEVPADLGAWNLG